MTLPAPWRMSHEARPPYPAGSVEFGGRGSRLVMTSMPLQDAADVALDDTARPREDGMLFGEDYIGASNITFELEVNTRSEPDAIAVLNEFRRAWRADAVRRTPGAVATLMAHTGLVTFGRPRKPQSMDRRTFQGRSSITAEFLAADDLWYGPEQVTTVDLAPATGGGVVAPVVAPVVTAAGSNTDRSRPVTIDGIMPTWISSTIRGPIINPVVELVGQWRFGFATSLATGETIDVVATPYGHAFLRNGTSQIATDSRSSLIQAALTPPGRYEFVLRGQSPAGLPTALATWRAAYPHW